MCIAAIMEIFSEMKMKSHGSGASIKYVPFASQELQESLLGTINHAMPGRSYRKIVITDRQKQNAAILAQSALIAQCRLVLPLHSSVHLVLVLLFAFPQHNSLPGYIR